MPQDANELPRLRFDAWRTLDVVDSHTCGQPTRVILDGAGLQPGEDPDLARQRMQAERDWVRRVAVLEPRGHRSMFVAALIPPAAEGGDFGVVYMDANGYPDMCGHATIGVATTLFELGLVGPADPAFTGAHEIALNTPAGLVSLRATLKDGRCESVAFSTPCAYHLGVIEVPVRGSGTATVQVAYGGQWYAFLPAASVGLSVEPDGIDALIAAAAEVRAALADRLRLTDPRTGTVPAVGNIVWTDRPRNAAAARNVPVSSSGSFDRSPCGTATCARMAALVANGDLSVGDGFVNEGVMGTLYRGRVLAPYAEGGVAGIVPEVEGSAWITARSQLRVDARDPLRDGYLIGGGAAVV